jgi:uncharacterized membrane protein YvbJ
MKSCPYCAAALRDDALVCTHCGRHISLGQGLRASGEKLRTIGCGLALLITVPIIVLLLIGQMC